MDRPHDTDRPLDHGVVSAGRFWEIDLLRGSALLIMIVFHLGFDLYYFGGHDIDVHTGFWPYLSQGGAAVFILLVGVSLSLTHSKAQATGMPFGVYANRNLLRGLVIFGLGMGISLATWIALATGHVVFGVLHLIGISIIISIPFMKMGRWNLPIGAGLVALGLHIGTMGHGSYWLLWTGIKPANFTSVDYFPLFPWFGLVILGVFFGDILYPMRVRQFHLPDFRRMIPVRNVAFLGRHSLAVYLAHQPIIIVLLHLTGVIDVWSKISVQLPGIECFGLLNSDTIQARAVDTAPQH